MYDMSGNVGEWSCSEYKATYDGSEKSCNNRANGALRVTRGGSWYSGVGSADRRGDSPGYRYDSLGFRLVQD
jgi:formylglycine-generating enzyme required for sulfatase activity